MKTIIAVAVLISAIISAENIDGKSHDVLHLGKSVYLLRADHPKYGNPSTVASIGDDGVFIVDPGPIDLIEDLKELIKELGSSDIKYVTTTHHHGDHSEALAHFKNSNKMFVPTNQIQYLKNSRIFLEGGSFAENQLPLLSYDSKLEINMNNESIEVSTPPNANGHTGGDAFIYFKKANVLAVGDYVFLDDFPVIDIYNGGSIEGFFENIEFIVNEYPSDVKIIPGHSTLRPNEIKVYSLTELEEYLSALRESVHFIREKFSSGVNLEQLQEEGLPEKFNWLSEDYIYVSEERWINLVHIDFTNSTKH